MFMIVVYLQWAWSCTLSNVCTTMQTFTKQENITDLRGKLATLFESGGVGGLERTSQVVRDCFPQVRGTSILDSFGLEVVTRVPNKEVPVANVGRGLAVK